MKIRLHQVKDAAEKVYGKDSVMSKVALAQAQQESGIIKGASLLASECNNLFGIKGKGTAGTIEMSTSEFEKGKKIYIKDYFAKNATLEDSFIHHKNLMNKPRYKKVLAAKSLEEAAQELLEAGYCTFPSYAQDVIVAYKAVQRRL